VTAAESDDAAVIEELLVNVWCRMLGRPHKGPFWLVRKGRRYVYATAFEEGLTAKREHAWPFDSEKEADVYRVKYGARVVRVREGVSSRGPCP